MSHNGPTDKCWHTKCPRGYVEWHEWAEKKLKTHEQFRCPHCNLWAIWKRKPRAKPLTTP